MSNLARMYADGLGTATDINRALELYDLAARRGEFLAQIALGRLYSQGQSVVPNEALALKWYSAAAAQKHSTGDEQEMREAEAYVAAHG